MITSSQRIKPQVKLVEGESSHHYTIPAPKTCQLKTNVDEINLFNDFYSDMFSLDFDSAFATVELISILHFVI